MFTRSQKRIVKDAVQEEFKKWRKANGKDASPDSFIQFDLASGKVYLDHKKAMDEGYYAHLRTQARSIMASWGGHIVIPAGSGSRPVTFSVKKTDRPVRMQRQYEIDGVYYDVEEIKRRPDLLIKIIEEMKKHVIGKAYRLGEFLDANAKLSRASSLLSTVSGDAVKGFDRVIDILKKAS